MNTMGAIHAALRAREIDKEDARDRFERVTGLRSLKAMDDDQRQAVLRDLNSDGFKGASKGHLRGSGAGANRRRKTLTGPYAKKLQALWIAGWNLGLVRNRDDKALLAFVKRMTGLEHTQFLHDAANAKKVIEALKSWLAREAGVNWSLNRAHGFQIALAQSELLMKRDRSVDGCLTLESWLRREGLSKSLSDRQWITVMNALGQQVRAKKAAS